jgi:hypothetical protein
MNQFDRSITMHLHLRKPKMAIQNVSLFIQYIETLYRHPWFAKMVQIHV